MALLSRFEKYVQEVLSIAKTDKILLAVSGGRDSMLMAHLFIASGYACSIAHGNFGLRGEESDLDEKLVCRFAQKNKVPFFVNRFETLAYAAEKGVSIQMAARDLRYAWFEALRIEQEARWIAVAQHQNDHIETALLNLTRGTGLQGLRGILPKRDALIRPILFLSSAEITQFVEEENIPFRDDQSNFSTKYARNKIRLEIIPKFREISPDFDDIMIANLAHFQEAYDLLQSFITPIRQTVFEQHLHQIEIKKEHLAPYLANSSLLFELFKPYGFTKEILQDLRSAWTGESGKRFQSPTHEILLDRLSLWLRPQDTDLVAEESLSIPADLTAWQFADKAFSLSISDDICINKDKDRVNIDIERLSFPLHLRFWEEGDVFYPLGMTGKKKLSDFFIQQKISLYDKKRIPILLNGNGDIIWIVGQRLDNRYRITESTKKVVTLVCK